MTVAALHDNVEVCSDVRSVTLGGESVQVKPAGVEADTVRSTVPVRPFNAVTVIVEVPEAPAKVSAGDTVPALIEKSTIVNDTAVVERDRAPSVAVKVTA